MLLGYGLAALSKPLFPLASGIGAVLAARFVDRIGKGLRGAPRDALIADLTPIEQRGAAYGLRQSMDTVGAFAGPLVAMALMAASHDNFRLAFWVAVIPAFLCVLLIIFGVQEAERPADTSQTHRQLWRAAMTLLPRRYWWVVAFATTLTMARFSEAFLLLRATDLGLAVTWTPLILIVMNIVYAASAYPFGQFADRLSRRYLLAWGILFLIGADLLLAYADNLWWVGGGVALWGLHMGATQGLFAALIADIAPAELRATAFGIFNLAGGSALLAASIIAGVLWTAVGPAMTFYAGAAFSTLALCGLLVAIVRG